MNKKPYRLNNKTYKYSPLELYDLLQQRLVFIITEPSFIKSLEMHNSVNKYKLKKGHK